MTPRGNVSALNVRPGKFDWVVIAQVCICTIPAMATIDIAQPTWGARYLAGTLFLMLGYYVVVRDRYRYLSLFLGMTPALVLMRGLFFYNSPIFFLGMGFALWSFVAWKEVRFILSDGTWKTFAFLGFVYWFLSFLLVHSWIANLRVMELVFTTAAMCLVSNRRSYLATAFIGMGVSVSAYAIAMLPYGVRLGEGDLDNGQSIGNPILVGLPAALILILALSDRGRYLLLENSKWGRLFVCLVAGEWLVLSGSRGSWLTTTTCLTLVFAFSRISRKAMLGMIGIGVLATLAVLTTGRGAIITNVFDKTVDSNRSLANRTSGRSAQWEAIPILFPLSPIWGYGPGSAKDVDYVYTHRHLLFHSLYLDVIVETGLMGFIPLMIVLGLLIRRAILHLRRYGEVTPLVGIVAFMLIGMSVTAFDCISGIFIGLAFMAHELNPRYIAHQYVIRAVREDELALVR
jgi:O-antigen ligase